MEGEQGEEENGGGSGGGSGKPGAAGRIQGWACF